MQRQRRAVPALITTTGITTNILHRLASTVASTVTALARDSSQQTKSCPFCSFTPTTPLLPTGSAASVSLRAHLAEAHRGTLDLLDGSAAAKNFRQHFDAVIPSHQRQFPSSCGHTIRLAQKIRHYSQTTSTSITDSTVSSCYYHCTEEERRFLSAASVRQGGEYGLRPMVEVLDTYGSLCTTTGLNGSDSSSCCPSLADRLCPSHLVFVDLANIPPLFAWWHWVDPFADRFLAPTCSPAIVILCAEPGVKFATTVACSPVAPLLLRHRRLIVHAVHGGPEAADHVLGLAASYLLARPQLSEASCSLCIHLLSALSRRLGASLAAIHQQDTERGRFKFYDCNDVHLEGTKKAAQGERLGGALTLSSLISTLEMDAMVSQQSPPM